MDDLSSIRDALDSCRPEDLGQAQPELAGVEKALASNDELREHWERSNQLDVAIADVFREVDLPHGLQDRLLASLLPAQDAPVKVQRTSTRRRLLWGIGSVVAATLVVALLLKGTQPKTLEPSQLTELALATMDDHSARWETSSPPAGHDIPGDVASVSGSRWRPIESQRLSGVAYDLTAAQDQSVLLLVLPTKKKLNLSSIPFQTLQGTGGLTIGAWRTPNTIYLIVGKRGKQQLWQYVIRPNIT